MNALTINIKLLSPLLLGSGAGFGKVIDTDIVFQPDGLPVFPARRLKGLLKESALEVIEMFQQAEKTADVDRFLSLLEELFGTSTRPGLLKLYNLHLPEQTMLRKILEKIRQSNIPALTTLFTPRQVKDIFTEIRQQTALDQQSGTALENTLRTVRILKDSLAGQPISFTGNIYLEEHAPWVENLLALACLNLRRAGSLRNRGLGRIEVGLTRKDQDLCQQVLAELAEGKTFSQLLERKTSPSIPTNTTNHQPIARTSLSQPQGKMRVLITTLAPLVLPSQQGNQNTVSTLHHIPGSALRGCLAHRYLKLRALTTDIAHSDSHFYDWFLSGKVRFLPAYPHTWRDNELFPTPLFIHRGKPGIRPQNDELFNLLGGTSETTENSKWAGGFVIPSTTNGWQLIEQPVTTRLNFHLTRLGYQAHTSHECRIKGHGPDEGIFYYEAIDSQQVFQGAITGDMDLLHQMYQILGMTFRATLGKSSRIQYGLVEIKLETPQEFSMPQPTEQPDCREVIMILKSPLLLSNRFGFPALSRSELESCLQTELNCRVNIDKCFARQESRQNFVSHWHLKHPQERLWSAGSAFLLRFPDEPVPWDKLQLLKQTGLGMGQSEGLGQVTFYPKQAITGLQVTSYPEENLSLFETPDQVAESTGFSKAAIIHLLRRAATQELQQKAWNDAQERHKRNTNHTISHHLWGRLEKMLQSSCGKDKFCLMLNNLKSPARTALEQYSNYQGESLISSLQRDFEPRRKSLSVLQDRTINCLKLLIPGGLSADDVLTCDQAYKLYWLAFCQASRKLSTS